MRSTRVFNEEKEILTDSEINALMSVFYGSKLDLRNKCICCLMFDSGLRRGEISRLKLSDVNFDDNWLLVNGKGNKQRYVPIGDKSRSFIVEYVNRFRKGFDTSEPLFIDRFGNSLSNNALKLVFTDLKHKTGIERLHAHLLRHTFATNYIVDGGDLETLRLILGHSDIQVTSVYLHMAANVKMLHNKHISHFDKLEVK